MTPRVDSFPIDNWASDMEATVREIEELGSEIVERHRRVSDRAEQRAEFWHLTERRDETLAALRTLLAQLRRVLESVDSCRRTLADGAEDEAGRRAMATCAETMEEALLQTEGSIVTVRQGALDLLRWTERSGRLESSDLPERYRAALGGLIEYAPVVKPWLERFQAELLGEAEGSDLPAEARSLVSALIRFNAVADSVRGFIRSVAESPLELLFHETEEFVEDLRRMPATAALAIAGEVNDCCQLLIYAPNVFDRRVRHVRPSLVEGFDASLVVLPVGDRFGAIFTVDEDPVFQRIDVTLLRATPADQVDSAILTLTPELYEELLSGS